MARNATLPRSSSRMGGLLASSRAAAGNDLAELSSRSLGAFSVAELRSIEDGEIHLSDESVAMLIELYGIDRSLAVSEHDLIVDLVDQTVRIGDVAMPIESRATNDVLGRYIDLVHLVRTDAQPGSLRLRDEDLDVLARSLGEEPELLRGRIETRTKTAKQTEAMRVLTTLLAAVLFGSVVIGGIAFLVVGPSNDVAEFAPAAAPLSTAPQRDVGSSTDVLGLAIAADTGPALSERSLAIEQAIPWDFRAALPGWTVIHAGPHPHWRGVTNSVQRTVTLFDRPGTSVDEAASVFAHELGHAVDLSVLDTPARLAWLDLRAIDGAWWAGDGQADFETGAGDFAEAVAVVLVGGETRSPHGSLTDEQLAFVQAVIDQTS